MIVELTSILNLDKINVSGMSMPRAEKLRYYEKYFLAEGRFANAIVVDEAWNIRAGYVTYLLARKYGVRPQIFEVRASSPLIKAVRGRYVHYKDWKWSFVNAKGGSWIYALKEPVIPGDILRVESHKGTACIQVDRVEYVDGQENCEGMPKALKHIRRGAKETI
ncbi:MAG: hypothetical protein NC541_07850 [bacterium]|nr:hypothetical protein [bacterium]